MLKNIKKNQKNLDTSASLGVNKSIERESQTYILGEQTMQKLEWLIEESADIYHAKSKENLSSHKLGDFRKCPYLYWKKHTGLIKDKDLPAYFFGRAAHTLLLEGRNTFEDEYAVGYPINPKTSKPYGRDTKAFSQYVAQIGKPVVSDDEAITLELMEQSLLAHKEAKMLVTNGLAEAVIRTKYCGVDCQIRMDYYKPNVLVDLKTCDDLSWFELDARKYGYLYQLAFYHAILTQVTNQQHDVYIIATEKKEPFRVGVWKISKEALIFARQENENAIERLKQCRETNSWPTGYEQIRIYDTY